MGGSAARLGVAAAIALAAGIGASAAPGAAPDAAAEPELAIVNVATPDQPRRSTQVLDSLVRRNGLEVQSRVPEIGQLVVRLEGGTVASLRSALADEPGVEAVAADRPVQLRYTPNDFAFARPNPGAPFGDVYQWNLHQSLAPAAWDRSKGEGAEVAVVDSGVDVSHPDLAGRISGTLDCDPTPCHAGSVADSDGHGTHVAGLACADSDNSAGIASLGFDCSIYAIQVVSCAAVGEALVRAADRGSDAINMSLGGCSAASIAGAVDYAWSKGSVPVAAGTNCPVPNVNNQNCNTLAQNYPAQQVQPDGTGPNLSAGKGLVATAAKYGGARASFAMMTSGVSVAAFGSATDSVAPGQGIVSTCSAGPDCASRVTLNGDNRFAYLVGTSMATPQVSGLVALMRSVNPGLSASKLVRSVKTTSSNCDGYGAGGLGWGVIRANRAVAAAAGKESDPPRSKLRRGRRGKLRIKSSDGTARVCPEDPDPSGVRAVRIFASRNGKPFRRIGKTSKPRFAFHPKRKGRYRFFSIAVDRDGNEEARPADPDTRLRVKRLPRR
jgi:serine protease